jgi:hypothetical protein
MSAVATPLFDLLRQIPFRTRCVNPLKFHPCIRRLLEVMNNQRRTLGEVLNHLAVVVRHHTVGDDEFQAAKVELLTELLLANQTEVLAALHEADGYRSLQEVVCGDPLWHAHVMDDSAETEDDVTRSAAQTIAVILLTTERD